MGIGRRESWQVMGRKRFGGYGKKGEERVKEKWEV